MIINQLQFIELTISLVLSDAEFRNTGLERSKGLANDLEWFKQQGHAIPEPSSPGTNYSQYLEELSEKDPQAFICHFYNTYFAHSAGGRMIGRKVRSAKILFQPSRKLLCNSDSLLHSVGYHNTYNMSWMVSLTLIHLNFCLYELDIFSHV